MSVFKITPLHFKQQMKNYNIDSIEAFTKKKNTKLSINIKSVFYIFFPFTQSMHFNFLQFRLNLNDIQNKLTRNLYKMK